MFKTINPKNLIENKLSIGLFWIGASSRYFDIPKDPDTNPITKHSNGHTSVADEKFVPAVPISLMGNMASVSFDMAYTMWTLY